MIQCLLCSIFLMYPVFVTYYFQLFVSLNGVTNSWNHLNHFLKQVVSCFYAVSNYFWELSDSRIRFTFRLAEFLLWFSGVQRVLNLKLLNTQVEVVFLGWVLLANVPSDTTNRDDNRVIWLTRFFIVNDIDEISWRPCIKAIGKTRNISKYRHY